jgi:hypothetical protein
VIGARGHGAAMVGAPAFPKLGTLDRLPYPCYLRQMVSVRKESPSVISEAMSTLNAAAERTFDGDPTIAELAAVMKALEALKAIAPKTRRPGESFYDALTLDDFEERRHRATAALSTINRFLDEAKAEFLATRTS